MPDTETGVGAMIEAKTKVGSPGVSEVPPEYAAMAEAIKEQHAPKQQRRMARWLRYLLAVVLFFIIADLIDRLASRDWVGTPEVMLAWGISISFLLYLLVQEQRPKFSKWILSTFIGMVGVYLAFMKIPAAAQQWMPFSVAQGLALWVYFVTWKVQDGTRQDFLRKDFWKWVGGSFLVATIIAVITAIWL